MQFSLAILLLAEVIVSTGCAAQTAATPSVGERLAADLTWTQAERDTRFAHMERQFPVHVVRREGAVRALPTGKPLLSDFDVAEYMRAEHLAGVLVLQNGAVRNERYGLGLTRAGHWTSFSMTKAVTDTLAGVALRQGSLALWTTTLRRTCPR